MTLPIDVITRTGDVESLRRYAQALDMQTRYKGLTPYYWRWSGSPSAEIGGLLATVIQHVQGHQDGGDTLTFALDRLIEHSNPDHEHAAVIHALVMHAHREPGFVTSDHALALFDSLRAMNHNATSQRFHQHGLFPTYEDLYALVRGRLLDREALAIVSSSVATMGSFLRDLALLVQIYGRPIFTALLPMVRDAVQHHTLAFLSPQERALLDVLAGSAHRHLRFLAQIDIDAHRGASANSLLQRMVAHAGAPCPA